MTSANRNPRLSRKDTPLRGKVALISGGSRGIGKATAELFAQAGAAIAICSRSKQELLPVARKIRSMGASVFLSQTDISQSAAVTKMVQAVIRKFGTIDILINNAGILGPRVPLHTYPRSEWERVVQINLTGTFYLTRQVAKTMIHQKKGCIITLSSSVGRKGRAGWGAYAVTKFALEGFTQVLADELHVHRIYAMTFNPGGTRTQMRAEAYPQENPATLQEPDQVAQALLSLVQQASKRTTGKSFDLRSTS